MSHFVFFSSSFTLSLPSSALSLSLFLPSSGNCFRYQWTLSSPQRKISSSKTWEEWIRAFLSGFPGNLSSNGMTFQNFSFQTHVFNFVLCKSSVNIRIKSQGTFTYYKDKYYWFGSSLWLFADLSVHSFCWCLESSWALLCFDHQQYYSVMNVIDATSII